LELFDTSEGDDKQRLIKILGTYFRFAVKRLIQNETLEMDISSLEDTEDDDLRMRDLVVRTASKFPITLHELFVASKNLQHELPPDIEAKKRFDDWFNARSPEFQEILMNSSPNILPFRCFEAFFVKILVEWYAYIDNNDDFLSIAVNLIGLVHNPLWTQRVAHLASISGSTTKEDLLRLLKSDSFIASMKLSVEDYFLFYSRIPHLFNSSGATTNEDKIRLMSTNSFAASLKLDEKQFKILLDRLPYLLSLCGALTYEEKVNLMSSGGFISSLSLKKEIFDLYVARIPKIGKEFNISDMFYMMTDPNLVSYLKMKNDKYNIWVNNLSLLRREHPYLTLRDLHDVFGLFNDEKRSTNVRSNIKLYFEAISNTFASLNPQSPFTDVEKQVFFNAHKGKFFNNLADLTAEKMTLIVRFIPLFITRVLAKTYFTGINTDRTTFSKSSNPTRTTIITFFKKPESLISQQGNVPVFDDLDSIKIFLKNKRGRDDE
jgi:hypothetical protein